MTRSAANDKRIALVDDEPEVLRGLERTLHRHCPQWQTFAFGGVDAALAGHGEQPFDVILCDIAMPGKTGFDLLKALRSQEGASHPPIVMVTGLSVSGLKKAALDLGASDLINKPVDSHELVARIRNVLRAREYEIEVASKNAVLEKQILHMQQTELVGLVTAGALHDLKNMVGGVLSLIGYIRLAPEETAESIRQMEASLESAMELFRQTLDLLRNRREGDQEKCDPSRVLLDAFPLMRASVPKRVDLSVDCPAALPPVAIDPTQFLQIVLNLVLNGAHAIDGRGTVKIAIEQGTLPCESGVLVTVVDTGCGMDGDTIENIFRPLFTTREHSLGSGLGLSIVKRLVERRGGRIDVKSELGVGTAFTVSLPIHGGTAAEDRASRADNDDDRWGREA